MSTEKLTHLIETSKPVLDVMTDAVCIFDEDDYIVYSNTAYERMVNRSKTELVADSRELSIDGRFAGKVTVYHDISEVNRLRKELERLNLKLRNAETKYIFKDIIGKNPEMTKVVETARIAAMTPATILIRGESGTGKEIFANAIHNSSPRRNEKFIKINCSALPEELLESELFGYRDGAFTGARRGGRKGMFQEADKGTLFLDEIGDVSPKMQVKLLRVLQEKEVMPLGASDTIPVDVRIICATNKPLEQMVKDGAFREDLYYRLNVFPLFIPPLRERKEDIKALSEYLLNKYNDYYDRNIETIEDEAVELLKKFDWPGNVRELENVLSRALISLPQDAVRLTLADMEGVLGIGAKEPEKNKAEKEKANQHSNELADQIPENLTEATALAERKCIESALHKCGGDKNKAAVMLGLPLRTLYYKCKKLGI